MNEIDKIDNEIKKAERDVEMAALLETLRKNPDFVKLVDTYLLTDILREQTLLWQQPSSNVSYHLQIMQGLATVQNLLTQIADNGVLARERIVQLNELRLDLIRGE